MISCTEFIPAYSELFSYIDETYGRDEVDRFWKYLFAPTGEGIPLINYVEREGIRGCFSYWAESLNEEAADFTMMLNERAGWFKIKMHRCPSKGRLLTLAEEIGITPYRDYCLHCDSYRLAANKVGLDYVYDFDGTDHAACSLLITDPSRFDGRVIVDENTEIMDRRAADNEYFHRDFHSSMNMGIEYLGACYGDAAVRAYLTRYTENVYRKEIAEIKTEGVAAIERKIRDTYEREKAADALQIEYKDGKMTVKLAYCPAVRHLTATGRRVSSFYPDTTAVVMQTLAAHAGLHFEMEEYDDATGAARYAFF